MLDIDFLAADKPSVKQYVFYVYETGGFRIPVYKKLQTHFDNKAAFVKEANYKALPLSVYENSLFGESTVFIDYAKGIEEDAFKDDFTDLIKGLVTSGPPNSLIVFIPNTSPTLKDPNWATISRKVTLIEEVGFKKSQLAKLYDFLTKQCSHYDFSRLKNAPDFLKALEEHIEANPEWTLIDVLDKFDFLSLICLNTLTDEFDQRLFRVYDPPPEKNDFYKLHQIVFDLLATPDRARFTPLFNHLTFELESGKDARMLVGSLYWVTSELFQVNSRVNPKFSVPDNWSNWKKEKMRKYASIPLPYLYHWYNTLLEKEPLFSEKPFMVALFETLEYWISNAKPD